MTDFDFQLPTRFVFGPGRLNSLGELAAGLAVRRALVVSDGGVVAAGHAGRGIRALEQRGIATQLFHDVCENPSTEDVEAGLAMAREFQPDLLVGLGGGSAMDCAKGINFLLTNGGKMQDYWGVGKAHRPMLPMIAVPTTAGTGSESQSFALISDAQTKVKMACGDKKAAFRIAILDPQLTLSQPPRVTALTGIDAISHAVETYVTKCRNTVSLMFSREAWRLLSSSYLRVLDRPDDLEARGAMQLGAAFAGLAIENSMLGAAHALANPLTQTFGIPHGEAVGLMLPHVIRFNGEVFPQWYCELANAADGLAACLDARSGATCLAETITAWTKRAGLATWLANLGVGEDRLPQLADAAAKQWTGTFNPRELTLANFLDLYHRAL